MTNKSTRIIEMSLKQNGFDFVVSGVHEVYGTSFRDESLRYKYGLLHIFSGILLLMKARLQQEHASLIFSDLKKSFLPDAKTVDFTEAIERLKAVAAVGFDRADLDVLNKVQKERNRLEHFDVKLDLDSIEPLIGQLIEFVDRFVEEQLGERLSDYVKGPAWTRLLDLKDVAERHREQQIRIWDEEEQERNRYEEERTKLRYEEFLKKMPKYRRMTKKKLEELHRNAEGDPQKGTSDSFFWCEECNEETVVCVDASIGKCTNPKCQKVCMLSSCPECGSVVVGTRDRQCEDCRGYMQHIMDKD